MCLDESFEKMESGNEDNLSSLTEFEELCLTLIFKFSMNFSQNFCVIFWQGCQCCKVAVLRSLLGIYYVLIKEMKFIFQFDKVSGIYWDLLNCSLYECHVCRLLVQRNVLRMIFGKKVFSISSRI